MKWYVIITTKKGKLELPFGSFNRQKKLAMEVKEKAEKISGTIKADVVKR